MADETAIEWADFTFNPWWGCAEVSPGCANCYARTWAAFTKASLQLWPPKGAAGQGQEHGFMVTGDANWRKPLRWAREAPPSLGRRPRVFCASMADVFEEHPDLRDVRMRLFQTIRATPELDWLLLTKRPEYARHWLANYYGDTAPLPNVWMGVSIENSRFTWRADVLREIPAAVRFISAEPLLGSLFDPGPPMPTAEPAKWRKTPRRAALDLTEIDWLIVGGESGPGARHMRLTWMLELLEACRESGTAPFVKQLGGSLGKLLHAGAKGGEFAAFPEPLQVREFPR